MGLTMALAEDIQSPTPSPPPFLPANRKHCRNCDKLVYLHQPVLMCGKCNNVYHGRCLRLKNSIIFDLQRTDWFCTTCCPNNNIICKCCCMPVFVYTEKFLICKNCFEPTHSSCSYVKKCLGCIPEFKHDKFKTAKSLSNNSPSCINSSLDEDYYNNLPFFNPFEEISEKLSHGITECDEVNDNFISNSFILNNCKYYDIPQFVNLAVNDNFLLVGLNIDGLKTNFDKFKIFNQTLITSKVKATCFTFYETNVSEIESSPFYLDGYNKFVLDKYLYENGIAKQKGQAQV